MAKLLSIESVAGLGRVIKFDDPLFQGWLEKIARTTEQQSRLLRLVPTGTAHPQAEASGLLVDVASVTNMEIRADEIWVRDTDNNPEILTSVSHTGVVFADVLDTGAAAASTWYYVFLVYNGTTSRVLISTSPTSPTMPAGYTHKGLLTAVRTTAGVALPVTYTQGRRTEIPDTSVLSAGTATVATAVSIATAAPPAARWVSGWGAVDATVAGIRAFAISLDGTRGIQRIQDNAVVVTHAVNNFRVAVVVASSQIVYQNLVANNRSEITITGWEF